MRICLNLDPSRLLRWHLWVAETLAANPGDEVFCRFADVRRPIPTACRLLLDMERLVYGARAGYAAAPAEDAVRALPTHADGPADLTVDFVGEGRGRLDGRVLTPLFDGIPGEIGIVAALTEGRGLGIELFDSARPRRPWTARPASADRGIVSTSLDGALSCAVALIAKAAADRAATATVSAEAPAVREAPFAVSTLAVARAAGTVAWKAAKLLHKLATGGASWTIGWRFAGPASLMEEGRASFRTLSGGSRSYLADPFPFRHGGRDYIFFEQFPYATNRGCIAVAEVTRDGAVGEPRIVLQEPHHLSYPFVFERDGAVFMIPEAGESKGVDLYRATEFPGRWEKVARLADGREIYDITPLERGGEIWFFACLREHRSTSWDILGLYHADGWTDPWTPHARNPVAIDAGLSRPAGAFIHEGGHVLRPVQNCDRYYGGGLTVCRIDALTETTFEQTPVGRICAGPYGCHTYNRSSGLEVVDLWGRPGAGRDVPIAYWPVSESARPILPFAQDVVPISGATGESR